MNNGKFYGIIVLAVLLITGATFVNHSTQEIVTITVTDKDRITYSDADGHAQSKYMVYTESEVFENIDDMTFGKFNSHDVQNQLKVGGTYKVKVTGFRIQFLSSTRNIIEIVR